MSHLHKAAPTCPDALILSRGLNPIIHVQPVTRQAYAALSTFPASETGAIIIHVDDFDSPTGPVAALDGAGLCVSPALCG